MSNWNTHRPAQEYIDRAWEKNPLMKETVDRLATTKGLSDQVNEYVKEYTPEENAKYRAYQMTDRIRAEALNYALWLEHLDEMEQYRTAVAAHNEEAWKVLQKITAARRAGRKTVKIADLLGD